MLKTLKHMDQVKGWDIVVFLIGNIVGIGYFHVMGITWSTVWENLGKLLWLGIVALFTGGLTVVGKYMVEKWLKKWNEKKSKKPNDHE